MVNDSYETLTFAKFKYNRVMNFSFKQINCLTMRLLPFYDQRVLCAHVYEKEKESEKEKFEKVYCRSLIFQMLHIYLEHYCTNTI